MSNKERIKHFYEVIVSSNLTAEYANYISEDCTLRVGETIIELGLEGMIAHAVAVRGTYPDLKMAVVNQFVDGDYIITEFIMEGTHSGEWLEMKPTFEKLSFNGVNIDKVIDGKIVEHSGAMNTFETLFEKGIIKPA